MDKKLIGIVIFGLAILSVGLLASAPNASAAGEAKLDMVFAIDTTGSMGSYISDTKDDATNLVDKIMAGVDDSRVGVLGYKDFGDSEDYMFKDYAYSSDKSTIVSNINDLSASGGGDWSEAVYEALMAIINGDEVGSWRSGATRVIMLMGDAPPHEEGDSASYVYTADEVISAAKAKDVMICTVVVSGDADAEEKFAKLAEGTGCTAYSIDEAEAASEKIEKVVEEAVEKAEEDVDDDVSDDDNEDFKCCFLDMITSSATKISGFFGKIF